MSGDQTSSSAPAPLRFDESAPAEATKVPACSICSTPISSAYFELATRVVCAGCKRQIEAHRAGGSPVARFGKACALGLGAALVGAGIYYAILAATGYEVGLVAILVGWLVGRGVQKGSSGRGGWVYQSLAVGLTYFAIVSTYVPLIIKGMREHGAAASATAFPSADSVAAQPASVSEPAASASQKHRQLSPGRFVLAIAALLVLAAAAPFLAGLQNLLGLLIIAFGLYQAWKLNRRVVLAFTGPYVIGGATAGAAASNGE